MVPEATGLRVVVCSPISFVGFIKFFFPVHPKVGPDSRHKRDAVGEALIIARVYCKSGLRSRTEDLVVRQSLLEDYRIALNLGTQTEDETQDSL